MSLKLPYKKYPTPFAKCGFYYSASVPVNIALPAKNSPRSKRFDAIIDSGASSCLFHASIGHAIGLEIEKGVHTQTLGIAGAMDIYVHEIALYAPGGIIIFDDYGWMPFHKQKEAIDEFMLDQGLNVLELPTGQGLLIKSK